MEWERIEVPGAWYEEPLAKAGGFGRYVWRDEKPPDECPAYMVLYDLNDWELESHVYWVRYDFEEQVWVAEPKEHKDLGLQWRRELEEGDQPAV